MILDRVEKVKKEMELQIEEKIIEYGEKIKNAKNPPKKGK